MTEITIHVQIGVTPAITELVQSFLLNKTQDAMPASVEQKDEPEEVIPVKKARKQKAEIVEQKKPAKSEETPVIDPIMDGGLETKTEYTEEDVRDAIHRTRIRIEGEDYKENADSDGHKKYHKALTSEFKNIAALLNADKPSSLAPEQRRAFIAECDLLAVDQFGNIVKPKEF